MATAYDTDLVDLVLAESYSGDSTGVGGTWTVFGGAGGTSAGSGVDYAMQGTNAIDAKINNNEKGPICNLNSAQTLGTGEHIFVWALCATVGISDTIDNRGIAVFIGTGTNNNYVQYHVNGSDVLNATQPLGVCYPIDYSVRTASVARRTVSGNPGANPSVIGATFNINGQSKGSNVATDAIRRGTGFYITGPGSGTFTNIASFNDNPANRYGLFTETGPGTFSQQGAVVLGQNSSKVSTAVEFADNGSTVLFKAQRHSTDDFTKIVVDNASSVVSFTGCTFSSEITQVGGANKGLIDILSANPTVDFDRCNFTSIGLSNYRSNTTVTSCVFRNCDSVTQNGATIASCSFIGGNNSDAIVIADDVSVITNCSFDAGNNTNSGLKGFATAGNYDVSSNSFTGYSGLSQFALQITATTGTVNIQVADASIPFSTAGATVNLIAGQVTTTITVKDVNTQSPIQNARVYLTAAAGGPIAFGTVIINALTDVNGQVSDTRSLASNQPVTGYARQGTNSPFYKNAPVTGTISSTNGLDLTALMIPDE